MASTTTTTTTQASRRHLTGVTPSQVEAMKDLDRENPATLAALVSTVATLTARDHDDVREHALLIVAAIYAGTPGEGWARTEHAAKRARKVAARTVALAAPWEHETAVGVSAGMAEYVDGTDVARTSVDHSNAQAPDRIARTTHADVVDVAAMGNASVARAVADYRHHAQGCSACEAPTAGRRPTLTGMTAHVEGWSSTDSSYWTSRRATENGLAQVDREAVLTAMDGAPLATRPTHTSASGVITLPSTPAEPYSCVGYGVDESGRVTVTTRRPMPDLSAVTVTTREGESTTRTLTASEVEALTSTPRERALTDGDGNTAPMRDTRRDAGATRPRPRKNGGAGQTGPTVPVHLSR